MRDSLRPLPWLALLCALAALAACAERGPASPEPLVAGKEAVDAMRSVADDDRVDLKVYLRAGSGRQAHLQAVTRQVPIAEDLPRRALELLVAGQVEGDPAGLRGALPSTTRVLAVSVRDEVAVVDLSPEVLGDAATIGPSPEHELVALGAIANTLTEFPEIDAVRVRVHGAQPGAFWGGWGLPPLLRRDERLIGPPREGEGIPDVRAFRAEPQKVGSPDAAAVSVRSVHAYDRLGYLRLEVELADGEGRPAKAVPATSAAVVSGRIVLEIADVLTYDAELRPGAQHAVGDEVFEAVEADDTELPGAVRIAVLPAGKPFRLHTLTSPTRVVLDVRK